MLIEYLSSGATSSSRAPFHGKPAPRTPEGRGGGRPAGEGRPGVVWKPKNCNGWKDKRTLYGLLRRGGKGGFLFDPRSSTWHTGRRGGRQGPELVISSERGGAPTANCTRRTTTCGWIQKGGGKEGVVHSERECKGYIASSDAEPPFPSLFGTVGSSTTYLFVSLVSFQAGPLVTDSPF